MDGHKFDQMTRTLANSADRRSVIRGLAGAALAMFGIGASSARMQDDDIISTAMQFQACMQSNLAMIDEAQELTPEGYQLVVRITQTLVDAAYETTETGRNPLLLTAVLVRLAIVDIPWFIGAAQNCISAFARGEFRSRVYNRVRQQVPACKPYFPELPEGPAYGCSRNQICCQESCTDPCPDGQSLDLDSDSLSCGECGISCDFLNGEICCDGVCADLASDSQNCGTCGGVCESGVCINGECVSDTCSDGLTRCNGECVDLESDANSCGACGTICGENEMCVVGRCVTDSQYRIVLTWGAAPSDLDSHLWLPEATPYHVYYANQGTTTAFPWAELDRDDTSSYGPETITLANVLAGTYSYAVYNYSGGSPLTSSGAVVELYRGSELLRSYSVPGGSDERWWQVFYLASDGTITDVNALIPLGESPGPYNAFSGTVQALSLI